MAKKITRKSEQKGDPVCVALLAVDSMIVGEDRVTSLIRIVDQVTVGTVTNEAFGQPVGMGSLKLVIMLKAGDAAKQSMELELVSSGPNGLVKTMGHIRPDFKQAKGPNTGFNVAMPCFVLWDGPGIYWIELRHKRKLLIKTPLSLVIDPKMPPAVEKTA